MKALAALLTLAGCATAAPPTLRDLYGLAPPRSLDPSSTALVLVDVQREFAPGGGLALPGVAAAADRARELLAWARARRVLVVHVRQRARAGKLFAPGSPGFQPLAGFDALPDEWVVEKPAGGAFTDAALEPRLRARGIQRLVVAGFMTHLAVAATAMDAATRGFAVVVASDATATRALPGASAAEVQRVGLAIVGDRAAEVMEVGAVLGLGSGE